MNFFSEEQKKKKKKGTADHLQMTISTKRKTEN